MKGWFLLFSEPLQATSRTPCVHVGVGTLPVLEIERALWQVIKWVLDLWLCRDKRLLFLFILLLLLLGCLQEGSIPLHPTRASTHLWCRGGLWSLWLFLFSLCGGCIGLLNFEILGGSPDLLELWVVTNRLVVSEDMGEL